jgi:hypothetical protein
MPPTDSRKKLTVVTLDEMTATGIIVDLLKI